MSKSHVLMFIAGTILGSGVAYAVTRQYYMNAMNDALDAALADYKQRFDENFEKCMNKPEPEEKVEEAVKEQAREVPKKVKAAPKVDYSKASEVAMDDVEKDNLTEVKTKKTTKKSSKKKPTIYPIPFDEYTENNGFEKMTLTYFEGDGVFMDEFDQPYLNAGKDIGGKEILDEIVNFTDSTMFVRNETLGTDFEIIFNYGSYADYVDGENL